MSCCKSRRKSTATKFALANITLTHGFVARLVHIASLLSYAQANAIDRLAAKWPLDKHCPVPHGELLRPIDDFAITDIGGTRRHISPVQRVERGDCAECELRWDEALRRVWSHVIVPPREDASYVVVHYRQWTGAGLMTMPLSATAVAMMRDYIDAHGDGRYLLLGDSRRQEFVDRLQREVVLPSAPALDYDFDREHSVHAHVSDLHYLRSAKCVLSLAGNSTALWLARSHGVAVVPVV